jgi:outer membrane protein TolC
VPRRSLGLDEALAFAREHQPLVRVARARIAAAKAAGAIPGAQWGPQVGLTAQLYGATANNTTASSLGDPAVDLPRIGGTRATDVGSFRPYVSSLVGVGVWQEIFDFGRIAAQQVDARSAIEIERLRGEADRLDVEFAVRQAFFAVQAAQSVVLAADGAFVRARAHRDLAAAGVKSGMRAPIDLTRVEAELTRFEVGKIRARGGLTMAQGVLAAAVGAPEPLVGAAGQPPEPQPLPALADVLASAAGRDPMIREAIAQIAAQEAHTRAIAAEKRPNLYLTGTFSGRGGGAPPSSGPSPVGGGLLPTVANWDLGLVLSWPFLDPVVSARKEASEAREDAARARLDERRFAQAALVQRAYFAVEIARSSLPALERALDAARKNQAQAEARFQQGLATSVELADAEGLLTESEIQLVLGRFELARARAAFGRAIAEGA